MILFSPVPSSTMMIATPVVIPDISFTPLTSIPSSLMPEMRRGPNSSWPTAPTILTVMSEVGGEVDEEGFERDRRAQATAWFAPFPPAPVENEVAVMVSPPAGT